MSQYNGDDSWREDGMPGHPYRPVAFRLTGSRASVAAYLRMLERFFDLTEVSGPETAPGGQVRVHVGAAGTAYDLRHACLSLWLNAGVPATEVADRAGNSVEVLLKVYAKCIDGDEQLVNRRIEKALRGEQL